MRTSRCRCRCPAGAACRRRAPRRQQPQADAKIGEVLSRGARRMGGDAALAKVQSRRSPDATRRMMGEREIAERRHARPAAARQDASAPRTFGFPAARAVSACRPSTAPRCGTTATNRGGGGFMMRTGGPGGPAPDRSGTGRAGRRAHRRRPAALPRQSQAQRMKSELARYALIWFLQAPMRRSPTAARPKRQTARPTSSRSSPRARRR